MAERFEIVATSLVHQVIRSTSRVSSFLKFERSFEVYMSVLNIASLLSEVADSEERDLCRPLTRSLM